MNDSEFTKLLASANNARGGSPLLSSGRSNLASFSREFDAAPELYSFTAIEQVVMGSNVFLQPGVPLSEIVLP